MNNKIGVLGGLLVIQLVLVAVALLAPLSQEDADAQLLAFDVEQADQLVISGTESEIEISRDGAAWQVAGVPADGGKVAEMLEKLAGLDAPWPVATSESSAARFEVDPDEFQRRVRVFSGDELLGELYLGTSPGYQRVHARAADSDEIFSVALSNYEMGVSADVWVDKSALALTEAPGSITLERKMPGEDTRTLSLTDEGWLYNGKAAAQDAAQTYANRFTTLRVLGIAPSEEIDDAPTEIARLTIALEDGERTYVISRVGDEDDYFITDAAQGTRYRVATYVAEQLLMTDAEFSPVEDETTVTNEAESTG